MPLPLNILIVEDSPDDADLVLAELRRAGFAPTWKRVETEPDFLAELKNTPDIILSDYSMPQFSGLQAAKILRESTLNIPFILISGSMGEDAAVEAMKHGATDYLLKDRLARLGAAVKHALEQQRLRHERRQAEVALRASEARHRTTLEHMTEGCQILGFDWRYLYLNDAAGIHNRRANAELLGRRMMDMWPGIESTGVFAMLRRCLEERIALHDEVEFVFPDGGKGWFDVRGRPVPEGLFILSIDITERKRAEEVLQKAARQEAGRKKNKIPKELLLIAVIGALAVGILSSTNVLQTAADQFVLHYQNHFDDVFSLLGVLLLGFMIFSYRRWQESRSEASQQTGTRAALHLLHGELETRIQQRTVELTKANKALRLEVAERQRAARELRASEELNRAVLNSMLAHIAVLDRDGKIVAINDAWRQFARENISHQPEQLARTETGTNYLEVCRSGPGSFSAEAGPAATGLQAVLLGAQNNFMLEYPCHSPEVKRWFILNATPLKSEQGGAVVSHVNITERRQAEDSLKLFRLLVDHSNDGVEVIDPVTARLLDVNETTCLRLGYSRAELLSLTIADLDPGTVNLATWPRHVEEIRQSGFKIIRGAHRRKDGSSFPIEVNVRYVRADRDYLIAVVRDITERLVTEQALREGEEKFRQLAENISDVFWIVTPQLDQIIYVSPAYEKLWGRTCASLYQSPREWLAVIHPDDRTAIEETAAAKMAAGDFDVTYRIHRPDGSLRWIHNRGVPVRNPAGEIYRIVGVAEDITQHRQLEEQFRQSQKMEAIGQLAGGVAHDFNNILAIIQMQTELLQCSGSLSADQSEFAGEIGATVQRAAALTRQLLLFSRREVFQPRDLDLGESITSTAKMLRRILGENVAMQLKLASQPMFIHADAGMMDQVLMNLAVNARDAMPNGGQLIIEVKGAEFDELAVAQSPPSRPGSFVCLSVSDSGSGIPPEVLPKIFEPFFTTKDVGKGTGLGLATVFGIVQQHQGWVNVYSEVGHGTTFRIHLPRLARNANAPSEQSALAPVRGGTETVLLVEDDPSLRVSIRKALTQLGYQILEASTGVKALEVWCQNHAKIHLLLTDLVMPDGINGKDLAHQLLQENPALKVVYMSGYSAEVVGKDFPLKEGVNFLTKPFQAAKLGQTIRNRLDAPA